MRYLYVCVCIALLLVSGCAPAQATESVDSGVPIPSELPTEITSASGQPMTTYTNAENGFSFDYPTGWMLDEVVLGDRAPSGIQLTSWTHEPGMVSEVIEGGTIMNIAVQLWDPKSDLEAFASIRLQAWEASGLSIMSQEAITLANGQLGKEFVVQGPDGAGYFLLTTLGENYLVASGSGDIEMIKLVARSIR